MRCSWSRTVAFGSLVLVILAGASEGGAIPALPPYATVLNSPLTIPKDGVLAVGVVDLFNGTVVTQGALDSVTFDGTDAVPGAGSEFMVSLDAETTQTISVWKPEQPFTVGSFVAVGSDEYGYGMPSAFEVVDGESAPLDLAIASLEVVPVQVPSMQIPCGTTFGISAEQIPVFITTHYGLVPALVVYLETSSSERVLSQHFFRVYRPGTDRSQFSPHAFADGERALSFQYAAPQTEYCAAAEALSLTSQQVAVLEPVCVTEDETDWTQTIVATSAEFDAQLVSCPEPPDEFRPRYCALREAQFGGDLPECDEYTNEELEEAGDTPIIVDDLPEEEPVEPTVEPSVEPVATPVTGEPEPAPENSPEPDVQEDDVVAGDPSGPNGENVSVPVIEGEPVQTPQSDDSDDGTSVDTEDVQPPDTEAVAPEMASDSSPRSASGSDGSCAVADARRPSDWLWVIPVLLFVGIRRRLRS